MLCSCFYKKKYTNDELEVTIVFHFLVLKQEEKKKKVNLSCPTLVGQSETEARTLLARSVVKAPTVVRAVVRAGRHDVVIVLTEIVWCDRVEAAVVEA
jgi:hypothetical protein